MEKKYSKSGIVDNRFCFEIIISIQEAFKIIFFIRDKLNDRVDQRQPIGKKFFSYLYTSTNF